MGLLNDLYKFDPLNLTWSAILDFQGPIPDRRAGHNMISYDDNLILFGGRSMFTKDLIVGMNDVWEYGTVSNKWSLLSSSYDTAAPTGRQYAAAAILTDKLYVFGGLDPSSGLIFSDLWTFSLRSYTWSQLVSCSGQQHGPAPPPLYLAHILPASAFGIRPSGNRLFLYGGLGAGGTCGNAACNPLQRSLGQLYAIDVSLETLSITRLKSPDTIPDDHPVLGTSFADARITSNDLSETDNRGIFRKLYGYESVAYSSDRSLLFEFGGLRVNTDFASEGQRATSFQEPSSLDSGGDISTPIWDLAAGNMLNEAVALPVQGLWNYSNGFGPIQPMINSSKFLFLSNFRIYKVSHSDMIFQSDGNS